MRLNRPFDKLRAGFFASLVILLAAFIQGACQTLPPPPPPPVTEANKAIVRRLLEEVYNQGNLAVADELMAADYVDHNPEPGQAPGREGFKQVTAMFRTVFPDLHITAEDIIAEGDTVMVRVTFSGTHQGEFAGLPPSGKQVTATEIDIVRIEDGKMVERWAEWDALGFLTQMGAIPPLEEVAALQEENRMLREVVGPPPASLADLYPPKSPAPVFWLGMLEMDQAATAMLVDLQQGDAEGAVANWEKFEQKYEELSQMVPEWSDRFPAEPLAAVREAVKAGDVQGIFAAFGPLGAACGGCHAANYLDTQFKYWWPDFGQVMVDDPMTQEAVPFGEFMFTVSLSYPGSGEQLPVRNTNTEGNHDHL